MTTIDHQQAARVAVANTMRQIEPNLYKNPANPEIYYGYLADDAIRAAAPHLRAETVDRLKNFRNDYQHTYAIPGDPYADGYLTACNAIIALLEGGGACCEHSKCPGGSICCCQEGGAE